jgi:hypothetical protein
MERLQVEFCDAEEVMRALSRSRCGPCRPVPGAFPVLD